jgi:hypothetical protein
MVDLLCFDDVDMMATELDDPLAEALQDFYHRLIEDPGSNPDDPDRGVGLVSMLSSVQDPSLAGRIDAEAKKDDRFDGADTTVTDLGNGKFSILIELTPQGSLLIEADAAARTVARVA